MSSQYGCAVRGCPLEPIRRGKDPQILIGGHPLNSRLMGVEFMVTEVEGWLDRPDIKQSEVPRERADGDFPTPWDFEPRLIEINGYAFCDGWSQQQHVSEQLSGLTAFNREWLTIQGAGATQSALVGPSGRPRFIPEGPDRLRFELRFKANDPRKTGALYTAPLGPTPTPHSHIGNYPATPQIRVFPVNATSGFVVEAVYAGKTRRWEYTSVAYSSSDHLIDMATGKHLVNGVEQPDQLGTTQLWDIPPRTEVMVRVFPIDVGQNTTGELVYRDTWI